MKHTLRERLEAGLIVLGYNQATDTTRRATKWKKEGKVAYVFVGRNGSFRSGRLYSQSFALAEFTRQIVLNAGDNALALQTQGSL